MGCASGRLQKVTGIPRACWRCMFPNSGHRGKHRPSRACIQNKHLRNNVNIVVASLPNSLLPSLNITVASWLYSTLVFKELETISIVILNHINKQLHLSTRSSCFADNPPRSLSSKMTLLLTTPTSSRRTRRRTASSVETSTRLAIRFLTLPKAPERTQGPRNKDLVFPETSHLNFQCLQDWPLNS